MGHGNWSSNNWASYKQSRGINSSSTVNSIYTARTMRNHLNPYGVQYRESCDSADHPNSTAVIIGLDVTGSMGYLAEEIAKTSLNTIITEMYDRRPIEDPHLMFMAIGDAYTDQCPLQVTQFEADIRIAEQLTDVYFEGRGGGNDGESYLGAWYFAARHTKTDCMEKHGRKGFLFTIGDEPCHQVLTKDQIFRIFGDRVERDLTAAELLNEVSRSYEVFHLVVGNHRSYQSLPRWQQLLGERAMEVTDFTKLPEIIESTLEVMAGTDAKTAANQWDGSTAVVVMKAIGGLKTVEQSDTLIEF